MILVVSYPGDEHTERVVRLLVDAGCQVARLDLSDYPSQAAMALRYGGRGNPAPSYRLAPQGGGFELTECRAGWWRRVRAHVVDPAMTDPTGRAFAFSETSQALQGMLDALSCTWINPPRLDEAAHRKTYQWSVARALGLEVPRTLVTNDPEQARAFVREVGVDRTVFKAFLASVEAWRETRLVREQELCHLESVRFAPVIFQEYVPGADLRVTLVGKRVFAAEIDATGTSYPTDMRLVVGEARVRAVQLPHALEQRLHALMERLGLLYGAIDLRHQPDGRYVFFEVNPAGQWLFVEQRTGLPITAAVAGLLQQLDDPRRPAHRAQALA